MNTNFILEFLRNYIHLQMAPGYQVNSVGMTELWSEIKEAADLNNCNLVLIEGTIDSWKMNISDVFHSGIEASEIIPHIKAAFYFVGCTEHDLTEFFQLVTENRGTRIMFFADRHKAFQWLGVEESQEVID